MTKISELKTTFERVPEFLYDDPRLSLLHIALITHIISYALNGTLTVSYTADPTKHVGYCFESNETLAKRFRVKAGRTIQRAVKDLIGWGYLVRDQGSKSHRITLSLSMLQRVEFLNILS